MYIASIIGQVSLQNVRWAPDDKLFGNAFNMFVNAYDKCCSDVHILNN